MTYRYCLESTGDCLVVGQLTSDEDDPTPLAFNRALEFAEVSGSKVDPNNYTLYIRLVDEP